MPAATFGDARETATPLIGRRLELNWLRDRLTLASRGYGHLVLVEGETGIGKTRLVSELLGEARRTGTTVVRGRCYEHLDLAYLPLRESLFEAMAQRLAARGAPEPELDVVIGGAFDDDVAHVGASADAANRARSGHLLTLTRLVIDFARREPTVLLVDDVDWADAATLDLLRHLIFRFDDERVPMLIVATLRADAHARAANAIARMRTEPRVATIVLRPLSEIEAVALARQRLPGDTAVDRARQLATAGGGNPLLVQALVHQAQLGPALSPLPEPGTGHPLTASIAARLDALDPEARRVVLVAALLGPNAQPELLAEVVGVDDDAIRRALTVAIQEGVVSDEPGPVAFIHPLFAHSLFEQTSGPTRRELHARIAAILLDRRDQGEPVDVRALAAHLIGAGDRADQAALAECAVRAGDEAMALTAWREASRCYEAALSATSASFDTARRATLHRSAALAHRGDMELVEAVKHLGAAIELVGADGDATTLADLHLWRIRCAMGTELLLPVAHERGALEDLVDDVELDDPALAAEALVELAQSYWTEWDIERSAAASRRAIDIANAAGSAHAYVRAITTLSVPQWAAYDLSGSLETLEQGIARARADGDDSLLVGGPLFRAPLVLAWLGRHDEAEGYAREALDVAERVHYPLETGLPLAALTQIAMARGDFSTAEHHAHQALLVKRLSGYGWADGLYLPALASAYVACGRYDAADDALATWHEDSSEVDRAACALFRRYVAALAREVPVEGEPLPHLPRTVAVGLDSWAAACVEIARREGIVDGVARAHDILAEVERRGGVFTSSIVALVPRVLGVARDLLGDEEGAIDTLRRAVAVGGALGAHAEQARAKVDLAGILLRRGEAREASSIVDEAVADLDRLGMAPDLARATALTGTATRTPSEPSTVERVNSVIFFSDVVDSTRLTEELGAVAYRRRARRLEELVTSTITAHGGTLVTGISLGDGFIGLFPTVEQAVQAARRCAAEVATTGLHLHLALTRGEILVDGPRIYGGPVNYAARLCALSGPDEILVSDAVRHAARSIDGIAFVDRGTHDMKGFAGPQAVAGLVDDTREHLSALPLSD